MTPTKFPCQVVGLALLLILTYIYQMESSLFQYFVLPQLNL